ncbi:hypothetical protein V6N13_018799 [Hibiscus sabdariffa]
MQAPTRRLRRAVGVRNITNSSFRSCVQPEGMLGKFDVLATIETDHEELGAVEPVVGQIDSVNSKGFGGGDVAGGKVVGNKGKVLLRGSGSTSASGVLRTQGMDGTIAVVPKESIVPSKVTLDSNNHVVVREVERGSDLSSKKSLERMWCGKEPRVKKHKINGLHLK